MGVTERLVERLGIADLIGPALFATGAMGATANTGTAGTMVNTAAAQTGAAIDMTLHERLVFIALAGAGASATGLVSIQGGTATASTDAGWAALTGQIGTATGSATATLTAGTMQEIEVVATALAAANKRYARAILTSSQGDNVNAGIALSVVAIAGDSRYAPRGTAYGHSTAANSPKVVR